MFKRFLVILLTFSLVFSQGIVQTTSVKASTSASVLTFEASSSASVLTFEAEAAEVITGSVSDSGSASGGKVVGGLGRSGDYDGYIQFNNISAPPSGKYLLHIYYQSAQFRRLDIIVNGGEPMMTYCGFQQAGDWSAIYIKTVIVDLNSGVNNLKLGASVEAWCPNIDKIELEPYTADSYESENAETAELTGNARIATNLSTFSGGAGVDGLGGNSGAVLFKNVSAARSGYYDLTIFYSTAADRAFDLLVNGSGQYRIQCPKTDSSDWFKQGYIKTTVWLNQGTNTIQFYNRSTNGWCPLLDKIETIYSLNQNPGTIVRESDDPMNEKGSAIGFGNWSLCSGGVTTSNGLGSEDNGYIQLNGIHIPRTGIYRFAVFAGYYGNSSVDIKFNNIVNSQVASTDEYSISTPDTGSWWTSNKSFIDVYMTEGDKTIKLFNKNGNGPTLDLVEIQLVSPMSFEAESAQNAFFGGAKFTETGDCSGGLEVEGLGDGESGGAVEFNSITVDKSGIYTMKVYYSTAVPRAFDILINDTDEYALSCPPSTGWWTPAFVSVNIMLNQGVNKIKFYNKQSGGWCPGLDKIDLIYVGTAPNKDIKYEAENALSASAEGLTVDNAPSCSGGKSVSGIYNRFVLFDHVIVPETGLYDLRISYINGDGDGMRKFAVLVNNTDSYTADCPPNTTWSDWAPGDMTLRVYLVKGSNTIKLSKAEDAWCPALDKFELTLAKSMSYEAESDKNTFSGATLFQWANCSGGMCVQSLGNGENGGTLTFNGVNVDSDGLYTIKVFHGSMTVRWFDILVNGTDSYQLECMPTSDWWTPDNPQTIVVRLKAGDNTLKFYNKISVGWCPAIDKIEVKPGAAQDPANAPKIEIEAENPDNDRTSGTRLAQGSDMSGGYSVELIGHGENGQSLTFKNINIEAGKAGLYTLTVDYATAEQRYFDIIVNGDTANKIHLSCPSSGYWWTSASVSTLITLQEGINTIKFYGEADWDCPGLDRIVLQQGDVIDKTLRYEIPESGTVAIEAEDAANTKNRKAYTAGNASCSGGMYVGGLGIGGYVQMNGINAPEDGLYLVNVFYTSSADYNFDLLVNDESIYRISCLNSGGSGTVSSQAGIVRLKQGYNKIKFFNNSYQASPNLDKIELSRFVIQPSENEYPAIAPGNDLGGGAQISLMGSEAFASALGGNDGGYVQINGIKAKKDGQYRLDVYYSCTELRTMDITVNGTDAQKAFCYSTGNVYNMQPLSVTVSLKAGLNSILLGNSSGDALNVEKIVVTTMDNQAPTVKNIVDFKSDSVKIEYDLAYGTADYSFGKNKLIKDAYSLVKTDKYLSSKDYTERTYKIEAINDSYGKGIKATVTSTANGLPTMKQTFYLYHKLDYFLTEVQLEGTEEVSSNLMAPVVVNGKGMADLQTGSNNRMFIMPYDNDMYYDMLADKSVNGHGISYEVSCLYDNASRNGLVFGSVTHDFWKTGIAYSGSNNKIDMLSIYGGATSLLDTDDICEHGSTSGLVIASPKIFIGSFNDWRTGLEEFAGANLKTTPTKQYDGAKPIGWNSWGAYHTNMTFEDAMKSSDYLKTLSDNNYYGMGNVTYMNLDAWSTNVENRMDEFIAKVKENGQTLGMYHTPFAYWGDDMNAKVPNIPSDYTWGDLVLKTYDGKYYPKQEGSMYYPLDPTHPGTKELMKYTFDKYKAWGVKYVKLDFMNGASCEGRHYDPNVKSGIQAFNEGMKYLNECATYDDGTQMFLQLELSPYFPYQYSHSHLVTSDIHHGGAFTSKYTLSCNTYGWWLEKLYPYSDSGIFTLEEVDNTPLSDEELAKARINSLVIAGSQLLVCINPDRADQVYLAEKYLTNKDVMELARVNAPFTPIEGATGNEPASVYMYRDGNSVYFGVFNLSDSETTITIDFNRAGMKDNKTYTAKDLWSGAEYQVKGSMSVKLNKYQSTIIKIDLK